MKKLKSTKKNHRKEYEDFIKTERGKEWLEWWRVRLNDPTAGDFGDYLYDFYPEELL